MQTPDSLRKAAAVAAAGLATAGLALAPSAATASPRHHPHHPVHECYQAPVQANPHVSVRRTKNGAAAVITVAHHLSGNATLRISPGHTSSVHVQRGYGYRQFSVRKGVTYRVTVSFPSSPDSCVVGGADSAVYRSAGGPGHGHHSDRAVTDKVALVSGSTSTPTGPSMLGLLGVGLVGAGTVSIVVNRRRRVAA